MIGYDDYIMAASLEDAFSIMESRKGNCHFVSGGTDMFTNEPIVIPASNPTAVDLTGIEELTRYRSDGTMMTIGSCITIQSFLEKRELADKLPLFGHAAVWFAEAQVRRQATVGGNAITSSPCADMIPCLLATEARLELTSMSGGALSRRQIDAGAFFQGHRKNRLLEGEILTGMEVPEHSDFGCAFKKVGTRRSLTIAVGNGAFMVKMDGDVIRDVRIVIGGVGPVARRMTDQEEVLKGRTPTYRLLRETSETLPEDLVASRSRREYRHLLVRNFFVDGLMEALGDLGYVPDDSPVREGAK